MGLFCGNNNCKKFGTYYHRKDDCCERRGSSSSIEGDFNSKVLLNTLVFVEARSDTEPPTIVECRRDYSLWVISSAIPLAICIFFTLFVWWNEERGWTKMFLLPVVFAGLYSQYRALKIILIGLELWPSRKQEEWRKEKSRFTQELVPIEPTTEALPTMLIQVALLSVEMTALIFGNRASPLVDNPTLFKFTFGLSIVLTVMGLAHFPKDGPSPLIPNEGYLDGYLTINFVALFTSILFWFVPKCLLLAGIVHYSAASGINKTEIERGQPSFRIEDYLSNLRYNSIAGIKLGQGIFTGVVFWMSTQLLPQLVYTTTIMTSSIRSKIFSLYLTFPSFLMTSLFTPFMYKASSNEGKYEFQVSVKHSGINLLLTILLTPLGMILFYADFIWESTLHFGLSPDQISKYQSVINDYRENNPARDEDQLEKKLETHKFYTEITVIMFVILPYILMLLAVLPTVFLLRISCSCNCSINATKYRNKTTFESLGKIRWQVTDVEMDGRETVEGVDNEGRQMKEKGKVKCEEITDNKGDTCMEDKDKDENEIDINDKEPEGRFDNNPSSGMVVAAIIDSVIESVVVLEAPRAPVVNISSVSF